MRKQVTNALAIVCPPDRLRERAADVHDLELGAPLQLVAQRHSISDDNLRQHAFVDVVDGGSAQDAVRDDGYDLARAVILDHGRSLCESPAGVRHVVHQDAHLVDDVSDQDHAPDLVGPRPLLVDQREGQVQPIGERGRALGAAGVRGHDDAVLDREVLLDPPQDRGLGVEIVDGHVEETLDLSARRKERRISALRPRVEGVR